MGVALPLPLFLPFSHPQTTGSTVELANLGSTALALLSLVFSICRKNNQTIIYKFELLDNNMNQVRALNKYKVIVS